MAQERGRAQPRCHPDARLVAAHINGDPDALTQLCRLYRPRLVTFLATRVGDADEAEDLAQEALLRACSRLHTFDISRPLWPWLKTIAHNLAIDYLRGTSRRPVCHDPVRLLEALDEGRAEPDNSEALAEKDAVLAALSVLNPRQRRALELRYLSDWSSTDVAQALDLAANACVQLMSRARSRLAAELTRLEDRSPPGVWLLAWPLHSLRNRLAPTRQAAHTWQPAAVAHVEGVVATVALSVVGASLLVAAVLAPSADHRSREPVDSARPPTSATAEQTTFESRPSQQLPVDAVGQAPPQLAASAPQAFVAAVEAAPPQTVDAAQTRVDAHGEVENDGERTVVLIETDEQLPGMAKGDHRRTRVEVPCDSEFRARVCDGLHALP